MTKIHSLRRRLLPCFSPAASSATASSKRLSASLRDDNDDEDTFSTAKAEHPLDQDSPPIPFLIPSRASKSMVICTFFGHRHAHVWFCVQLDRLSIKPSLLLELSLSTHNLVKEMRVGSLRIALECNTSDLGLCPLHSVPIWTMFCNGKRVGSASKRTPTEEIKLMFKKMQSMTVGAGVIPSSSGSDPDLGKGEIMYMRANYEWVIGGSDSESFHLISPEDCPGQELSVFLLRSN